jgi:hypothetical protein
MRHHSLVVSLVSLLAGCAASTPSGPAAPGGYPAGQWRSLTPEQLAPAVPANALLEPLGGRVRSIGTEEIVVEIVLANASTAPGTNQITVAVDMVSPYTRSRKQAPATATYEIDPAQRLELLGTYFPDEVQAGAPQTRAVPGGTIGLLPANYPDGSACVLAWQEVEAADQRWQPEPSRIFKTMRVCAPALELDPLLRSFADLDVYRIVHAGGA